MKRTTYIHERRDRKMQPFYWILSFECFTLLIIFGLAMAGFSAYGAVVIGGWAWLLVLLSALGAWLVWIGGRQLKKFVWENTHLSSYRLYSDYVEVEHYDKGSRVRSDRTIPLSDVTMAAIGNHVAMYHYAYKETKWREQAPLAHVLPSLFLVCKSADGQRAVEIPFYEYRDMELWLRRLQELGVPLTVYTRLFHETNEQARAMMLTESEDTMAYTYEEALELNHDRLLAQIQSFGREAVPQ